MNELVFDDQLQVQIDRLDTGNADMVAKVCYGLNIRSYHNECVEYARKGLAHEPRHAALYYELIIASSLDTAHILNDIRNELDSILDIEPDNKGILRNLALVHYFLEEDDEAERLLLDLVSRDDKSAIDKRVFEVLAQLEYTRQNMEQCIYYCDKAIALPGTSARVTRLKGLCYQEFGDLESARKCFYDALSLEPSFVWACHSLGSLHLELAQFSEAFRIFGKATYINPLDPGNLFLVAEAFMDMDAYHLADGELNKLLLCKPGKRIEAEVHNALGYIGIKTKDYRRAKQHLSLAIEMEPELAVAYYNMGQVARQEGNGTLAEHHFKNALEYDPHYVEAWVEMGFLRLDQKKLEDAEACFKSALEVDPYEALAFLGLSKMYHRLKKSAPQLDYAIKAFDFDPEHPEICNNLGIAYECNKQYDEAEGVYLRCLDLDPFHSQAANNLGYLCETRMKEPEFEKEYRRKGIEAWAKRLQICVSLKKSTKGAITHLLKLGLTQERIDALAAEPYKVGD